MKAFTDIDPKRKINPQYQLRRRPDNTLDDDDRFEIGPTRLAYSEWEAANLTCPDVPAMYRDHHERIVASLNANDLDGLLLFDPISIRYATGSTLMVVWNAHNPFRHCLVLADGTMILWDFKGYSWPSAHNPLVSEVRPGAGLFYFSSGERVEEKAVLFGADLESIFQEHCGKSRRIAIDKIPIPGLRQLDALGFEISDGEALIERIRSVKGADDIRAMRCSMFACERSIAAMRDIAQPGLSESDIWAELHAANIRRGGEWIETRLLSSGPRTNPWLQECSGRIVNNNELVCFDTDLIGVYGQCCDISRSWFIGDGRPTDRQRELHAYAYEHIHANAELVAPGVSFRELSEKGHQLAEEFLPLRYGARFHGVGLADEWPRIAQWVDWEKEGITGVLEPGMMLCVEAYVGALNEPDGIKLENQLLVTETGFENMSISCPYDDLLES